ncbi:MAG: hypothetical protein U0800_26015 [Isosphaeraceae bacterium]
MTVGELGRRMTHSEFVEWIELESLDPIPDPHLIGAQIAATTAQCFSARRVKLADFLPRKRSRPGRKQSVAEMRSAAITCLAGIAPFVPDPAPDPAPNPASDDE